MMHRPHGHAVEIGGGEVLVALVSDEVENFCYEGGLAATGVAVEADGRGGAVL